MKAGRTIALTGGVASGKSSVASVLEKIGVPVLDTDVIAHELLMPGHAVCDAVIDAFGRGLVKDDGSLDRRALARLVFSDALARARLNGLMHPAIYEQVFAWIAQQKPYHAAVVVVIPLLYETGMAARFDRVLVVAADEEIAIRRMLTRGWTREEAVARLAAQMPLAGKIKQADAVIWNNSDLRVLEEETLRIWSQLAGPDGRRINELSS